jgi:hypothetical protein
MTRHLSLLPALLMMSLLGGCASMQYSALEQVGIHKRDILVDRVEHAREAQAAAKQEVTSAYEAFTTLVAVDGGELEATYKRLRASVDDTGDSVAKVDQRIAAIERVAGDLFAEWREELDQYSNASLRGASERSLNETRARYERMLASMKHARSRIDPVLRVFQDHVLFLKHNLNARALASLQSEVTGIEGRVDSLIRDMEAAIAEADDFIRRMQ